MKIRRKLLSLLYLCFAFGVLSNHAAAQNQPNVSRTNAVPANEQNAPIVAEIRNLQQTLQNLNDNLREISRKIVTPTTANRATATPASSQNKLLLSLDILTRAEQRAELLRRQLIEMSEKEIATKNTLAQIEENLRPENIERNISLAGSVRAPEMRDQRENKLKIERDGQRELLQQVQTARQRLDSDVRQADDLVQRLRQKLFPAIEKQIENLTVN